MEQILLGLALVAICILAVKRPSLPGAKTPVQTASAEVISRKGEMGAGLPANWGGRANFQVTFRVEDKEIVLSANAQQYTRLPEGTKGTLTWRDHTLVSFTPGAPETDI